MKQINFDEVAAFVVGYLPDIIEVIVNFVEETLQAQQTNTPPFKLDKFSDIEEYKGEIGGEEQFYPTPPELALKLFRLANSEEKAIAVSVLIGCPMIMAKSLTTI